MPSDRTIRADVQEYINEILNTQNEISIFEIDNTQQDGSAFVVDCKALYGENQGEFTLTYELENGNWSLISCRTSVSEMIESPNKEADTAEDDSEDDSGNFANGLADILASAGNNASEYQDETVEEQSASAGEPGVTNNNEEQQSTEISEQPLDDAEVPNADEIPQIPQLPQNDSNEPDMQPITEELVVSDNLYDFTFMLDGVVYQLPCAFSSFTDNGWTISSTGSNGLINANSYTTIQLAHNGNKIYVDVINMSGNAKALEDCKIGGVDINRNSLNDWNLLEIAKGITLNSSLDEITAAFGSGNSINTYSDYTTIRYTKDSYVDVRFVCYSEDVKYNEITMRNYVSDENDITETSTEVPEYLSSYQPPIELGNDLTVPVINLDGDLYALPAPVSVFLDDGWIITQKYGDVGAGNTDQMRLERNGHKLYVYIVNFAQYQTIPENCAIYSLSIDYNDAIDFELPAGLTWNSTKADVENAVTEQFS